MKKLVIFLIPFIVSISAYALDESLVTENFSLVKDPGSNNRGFFNFKISFPSSYLFFNENKRHSRQYQAFQKFRFHQYSERTPLSRIATVEDGRQNWGDMYNLIYGQQENISSEEESESLAFGYLKRFAERNKKRRKKGWYAGLIGGGISSALGAAVISSVKEEDSFQKGLFKYFTGIGLVAAGVGTVVGGILVSVIPSRAERKLKDVLSISDLAQRERASHEALSLLAARGRRGRILGGIFSAALSVGSVAIVVYAHAEESEKKPALIEYFYACAAGGAALAVLAFVVKSPGERTFEDYLKERKREQRKELGLRLGITPYGGVKIGLVYSF
jgi:hypothetical protein